MSQSPPFRNKLKKAVNFGQAPTDCFDFEKIVRYLFCKDDGDGGLEALPVFLVDPCQGGVSPLKTATISALDTDQSTNPAVAGIFSNQGHMERLFSAPTPSTGTNTFRYQADAGSQGITQTSLANTAQNVTVDLRQQKDSMSVLVQNSGAGTETLTIDASIDNSTFVQVESVAAAATIVKIYGPTTAGAGTFALAPLSFRWLKFTVGAGGVGNTTTLTVAIK